MQFEAAIMKIQKKALVLPVVSLIEVPLGLAVLALGFWRLADGRLSLGVLFFFQAEDGIRDVAVTGVQTCALPISDAALAGEASSVPWLPLRHLFDAFAGIR